MQHFLRLDGRWREAFPSDGMEAPCLPQSFHSLPFLNVFAESGPGLSTKRLRTLAQKRLLHCIVMVLNKMFLGRWPSFDELRRPPNAVQMTCFERLYRMVTVCGSRSDLLPVAPGRSGPELIDVWRNFRSSSSTEYFTGPPMRVSKVRGGVQQVTATQALQIFAR